MDLNQRKLSEITISHWSHTIVMSVGYQSFMTHLEKENAQKILQNIYE